MDWQKEFGFNINKASTIKAFYQRMMNDFNLFSRYEAACYGMNWFETQIHAMWKNYYLYFQLGDYHQVTLCLASFYELDDPNLKKCYENCNCGTVPKKK